jgi:hypothetical protein
LLAKHESDEQSSKAAVAVQEWMDRLELYVHESCSDQYRKVRSLFVEKEFEFTDAVKNKFRGRRYKRGVSRPTAADPVLVMPELSWLLSAAAPIGQKYLVNLTDETER